MDLFFFFKMGFIAMNFTHHLGEEINDNIFFELFWQPHEKSKHPDDFLWL